MQRPQRPQRKPVFLRGLRGLCIPPWQLLGHAPERADSRAAPGRLRAHRHKPDSIPPRPFPSQTPTIFSPAGDIRDRARAIRTEFREPDGHALAAQQWQDHGVLRFRERAATASVCLASRTRYEVGPDAAVLSFDVFTRSLQRAGSSPAPLLRTAVIAGDARLSRDGRARGGRFDWAV
jgi:hypothetical protein